MMERLASIEDAINWTIERLQHQIFLDKVQAYRGAFRQEYIIYKEDSSDRYNIKCMQHKYLKLASQMFYGTIVDGRKRPGCFWEKEQGSINLFKYNLVILQTIQSFIERYTKRGCGFTRR